MLLKLKKINVNKTFIINYFPFYIFKKYFLFLENYHIVNFTNTTNYIYLEIHNVIFNFIPRG